MARELRRVLPVDIFRRADEMDEIRREIETRARPGDVKKEAPGPPPVPSMKPDVSSKPGRRQHCSLVNASDRPPDCREKLRAKGVYLMADQPCVDLDEVVERSETGTYRFNKPEAVCVRRGIVSRRPRLADRAGPGRFWPFSGRAGQDRGANGHRTTAPPPGGPVHIPRWVPPAPAAKRSARVAFVPTGHKMRGQVFRSDFAGLGWRKICEPWNLRGTLGKGLMDPVNCAGS